MATPSELAFSIGPPEYEHTSRPGFLVRAALEETGVQVGWADGFEGYSLGKVVGEEMIVEPNTLHLRMVHVFPGAKDASGAPLYGAGTALARKVIERGVELGLGRGRTEVINARMVRILEKLRNEGVIDELELYAGRPLLQRAERLRLLGEPVTPKQAKEMLNNASHPDKYQGASSTVVIRTLFAL